MAKNAEGQQLKCDGWVRMDFTVGTRTTAAASAAALIGGVAITIHGIFSGDMPRSLGGTCLATPAAIVIVLVVLRRWIQDTSSERQRLADAEREAVEAERRAENERSRFFALEAAATMEQNRYRQDMAAERAAMDVRLKSERDAMQTEFEAARGELGAQAMDIAMSWIRGGKFNPTQERTGNLIHFPHQQAQPEQEATPQRERSRGHGEVAP